MKIQLAQVDPLGEALHFLRMTGVLVLPGRIHGAVGARVACIRRLSDIPRP